MYRSVIKRTRAKAVPDLVLNIDLETWYQISQQGVSSSDVK